jgi:hypothetical protein
VSYSCNYSRGLRPISGWLQHVQPTERKVEMRDRITALSVGLLL